MKSVTLRLDDRLHERLEQRVAQLGTTQSEALRQALEAWLEEPSPVQQPQSQDQSQLLYETVKNGAFLFRMATRQFSLTDARHLEEQAVADTVEALQLKGGTT